MPAHRYIAVDHAMRTEGNYHHKKLGRPAERKPALGGRQQACIWRDSDGVYCGAEIAKDSFAYCEVHKIEVRRSV